MFSTWPQSFITSIRICSSPVGSIVAVANVILLTQPRAWRHGLHLGISRRSGWLDDAAANAAAIGGTTASSKAATAAIRSPCTGWWRWQPIFLSAARSNDLAPSQSQQKGQPAWEATLPSIDWSCVMDVFLVHFCLRCSKFCWLTEASQGRVTQFWTDFMCPVAGHPIIYSVSTIVEAPCHFFNILYLNIALNDLLADPILYLHL